MIKDFRHVGIIVTNLDESLKFYRDLLGLKVKSIVNEEAEFLDNMLNNENVKIKVAKLHAGNSLVELIESKQFGNKKERNFFTIGASHFALTVDNLQKTYEYLLENNVKFTAPPQLTPVDYGPVQVKVTFCKDPDGTPIELVEEIK